MCNPRRAVRRRRTRACHCHTWSAGSGMSDTLASHVCVDTLLPHESVGVSGPLVPFAHHPVGRRGWEVPDPAATTRTPRCWPCGHRSDGDGAMHQALAGIGGSQPSRRSGKEEHRTDVLDARSVGHDSHPPPAKLRGARALALFRVWRNLPCVVLIRAKLCVQHCNHTSTWRASWRCCGLHLHALRSLGSSSDQVISLYRHAPVVPPYIYTWLVRILLSLPSLIPSHQSPRTSPPHPPLGQGSGTMGDDKATAAEEVHDASPPSLGEWDLHQVLPQHDGPWYKKRHLLVLNLCMVIPYLSSTTNGYDGSLLNGLQSMKQWQSFYNTPTGARLGSLSNGVIFGQILAFPVAPWLCERTGRRFPIFLGSLLLVIGAILQCASQNYAMFLVSRMIIGFGGLIAVEPSPMLVSELAYPTHRAVLVGYYNNLWYLGATLAAWVTYGTYFMGPNASWAWRLPSLLQGFLPLFQVLFIYFLPESPRWLVQRDR